MVYPELIISKYLSAWVCRTLRTLVLCGLMAALFLLSGCITKPEETGTVTPTLTTNEAVSLYSWVTYWDNQTITEEMDALQPYSVGLFGAQFSEAGKLISPNGFDDTYKVLEGRTLSSRYLTVVNDVLLDDGTYQLKNADVIRELLSSEDSMNAHIDDLISFTKKYNLDGIEIDYENFDDDEELWQAFVEFLTSLYKKTQNSDLALRVILETSALKQVQFPEGPSYSVMAYNLHGGFSEPGAKADMVFIDDLIRRASALPGDYEIAFAAGGYDWFNDTAKQITELKIREILSQRHLAAQRDPESLALFFPYIDDEGTDHEIWFADDETLLGWINHAREAGVHKFSLWRIGGNEPQTLSKLQSGFRARDPFEPDPIN